MEHFRLLSGLDSLAHTLVGRPQSIRGPWVCSGGTRHTSLRVGAGGTLAFLAIVIEVSAKTAQAVFSRCQGIGGDILHKGVGRRESHWDRALHLWWAEAKRNKTGIVFRAGKSNLITQTINLKGHFRLPQWAQMLHFTLGKRYF